MPSTRVLGASSTPELKAYLAVPATGAGPWPGVVVLHEAFGLTDDTRQQADRLAAAGYLALAPDLFSAGGALRCLRSTFGALTSGEGAAYGDIEASRASLAGRADCTGRIGVVASYGRCDLVLRGAAADLEKALTEVGVTHDVVEYPDAGHSFLNRHDAGPLSVLERIAGFSYHQPSAEDAWTRILRFFAVHLS